MQRSSHNFVSTSAQTGSPQIGSPMVAHSLSPVSRSVRAIAGQGAPGVATVRSIASCPVRMVRTAVRSVCNSTPAKGAIWLQAAVLHLNCGAAGRWTLAWGSMLQGCGQSLGKLPSQKMAAPGAKPCFLGQNSKDSKEFQVHIARETRASFSRRTSKV
ncbi:ark1 [Symbiodinium sp. CCMP2592]|nr:ark1 [Symbiodinium sp. CCMP2592]